MPIFQRSVPPRCESFEPMTADYRRSGQIDPSPPRGQIGSFDGTFRNECLNANWFLSIEDAWEKIEKRREEYNMFRPRSSLGDVPPQKDAEQ